MSDLKLSMSVQLAQLRKDLVEGGQITKSAAADMLVPLEKQWRRTEIAGKQATAALKKQTAQDFADIQKAGDKMTTGLIGDLADYGKGAAALVSKLGPVGTGIAAIGVGSVGIVVGVGAAVVAVGELVDQGQVALKTLRDMGQESAVSAEAIDALDDWAVAAKAATVESAALTAGVGGGLAQVFRELPAAVTVVTDKITQYTSLIDTSSERTKAWNENLRTAVAVLSLGTSEIARSALGIDELDKEVTAVSVALGEQAEQQEQGRKASEAAIVATRALENAEKTRVKGVKDAKSALDEARRAQEELTKKYLEAFQVAQDRRAAESLSFEDDQRYGAWRKAQIDQAITDQNTYNDNVAKGQQVIEESQGNYVNYATVMRQMREEANAGFMQDVANLQANISEFLEPVATTASAVLGPLGEIGALISDLSARQIQAADEYQQTQVNAYEAAKAKFLADREEMTAAEKRRARAELGNLKQIAVGAKKLAQERATADYKAQLAGFRIQQGAQAAQAIISAAQAALAMIPGFAFLGPGAPAAAAGAAGLALIPQLAVIATAKPPDPPKFHQGRSADEFDARLLRDERVLTAQGARNMGGDEAIRAANQGQGAQQGAPITLHVYVDGQKTTTTKAELQPVKQGRVISGWVGQVGVVNTT